MVTSTHTQTHNIKISIVICVFDMLSNSRKSHFWMNVVNDCWHQYLYTGRRNKFDEKSLTHKWDGCSMRLDTPSLRSFFEWKIVDTHSVSFAASKPTPLTLQNFMKPSPFSLVSEVLLFFIRCIRAVTVMWNGLWFARSWMFWFTKNRFDIQFGRPTAERTDCRSVAHSFGEYTIACNIRIRISAACM